AVPSRTTLPVLANILVEANDEGLQMTDTDLALSVTTPAVADVAASATPRAVAEVKPEAALPVPAKKLLELVRKLPKEELKLEAKDLTLNVGSRTGRFKFLCIRPEEFPARVNVAPDTSLTIDSKQLERMIKRTIYAVSTDETR